MVNSDVSEGKLELIAVKSFKTYEEMYKIVDFLNKTLKYKNIIFGVKKDDNNETMRISIYET